MKKIIVFVCALLFACWSLSAQDDKLITIEVGVVSTTHILFSTDLSYVDVCRPDVVKAKVVDASKNMLALKANGEFDFSTTVSALESNGTMHTFLVKYNPFPKNLLVDTRTQSSSAIGGTMNTQIRPEVADAGASPAPSQAVYSQPAPKKVDVKSEKGGNSRQLRSSGTVNGVNVASSEASNFGKSDAPTLEEIMRLPQQVYHVGARNFKITAFCTNVFVYSDVIYLVLNIQNNSDIGYEAGEAQFSIESAKRNNKKHLASDKDLWAKSSYGNLSCPPKGATSIGYTIPKFTLLKDECLKIYIYEKKGNRNLELTLYDKDINYAVSPK